MRPPSPDQRLQQPALGHPRRRATDRVDAVRVLAVGGEMAARIAAFDWSKTPIGPIDRWPISLRSMVAMVLENRFPMLLCWGRELRELYNDSYVAVLGGKHPDALGRPVADVWSEIWPIIGPQTELVLEGKGATWNEHLLLPMNRKGFLEETYFTFSYSPVRDDGGAIGGMLVTCQETTEQVQGERQLQMLRDLGAEGPKAKSAEQACRTAAGILANNDADIPFALFYLVRRDGAVAELVATAGLDGYDGPGKPALISLRDASTSWPLPEASAPGSFVVVSDLATRFGRMPGGRWEQPAEQAVVLGLFGAGQSEPQGFLVAGVSPLRIVDESYQRMFRLTVDQIVTAVGAAHAFEEERQRAEGLAALDRAKTAFFSNVSHEFRTPLTLMLGPTEDLLAGVHGRLPPQLRVQLEIVHRNALRLNKLVNSLLDFARLETSRLQASYEPVDLPALTRELASSFGSAVERAGLTLQIDCPPLDEPIFVDRDMWEKIVLNLISNALKFTFEGGITVSVRPAGDRVALRVEDTGVGILPEEIAHLFERFYRVEGTRARTHEGSGIGLAVVQELTKMHGGVVRVESTPGRGTAFIVTIPRGSAHLPAERIGAPRPSPSTALGAAPFVEEALRWLYVDLPDEELAPASPAVEGPARILIADDNADMRDYLRRLLAPYWAVVAVADGEKALAAAQTGLPDLILTDVMMPGLNGFELLRRLRADDRTRAIPVVMLSARAGEEAKIEGLHAGADDYLTKPFSARELIARVRTQLEQVKGRRQLEKSEERFRAIFELAEVSMWEEDFSAVRQFVDELAAIHGPNLRRALEENPDLVERAIGRVRILNVNPATLRMFGAASKDELLGSLHRIFTPETSRVFLDEMIAIAERKRVFVAEAPLQSLKGERIDVAFTLAFPPEDEAYKHALVTLMDLSIQKSAQREREARMEEMERALRFSEMFVGIIGHDLRNPLNAITTAAALIERRADSDRITRPVSRISASAHRMERMISQLLDFTRIRLGGGLPLDRTRVVLSEVAQSIIEELEPVHRKQIQLVTEGDIVGTWDRDRLSQLLSNLAANACQHGAPDLPVQILIDGKKAASVRIEVHNQGVIPAKLLPVVFEPLRHSGGRAGGASGLGLGLFITEQIAVVHGGTIGVESNEQAGTRFIVELPREPALGSDGQGVGSGPPGRRM